MDGKWQVRSSNTYFTWGVKGVVLGGWNYSVLGKNILLPFLEHFHNMLKDKSSTWFMFKCNCILISSCISRSLYLDFLTSMLVLSRMQWPRPLLCCATADFLSWYRRMWWWWWLLNLILTEWQVCPIYTYPNLQGMLHMSNDMGLKIPDIQTCKACYIWAMTWAWKYQTYVAVSVSAESCINCCSTESRISEHIRLYKLEKLAAAAPAAKHVRPWSSRIKHTIQMQGLVYMGSLYLELHTWWSGCS